MFTCTASGGGSMAYTYTWLKDGTVVSGQTSSTYSFSPLMKTDSGRYSCRVSVGSTNFTSEAVTITVVGESCTAILSDITHSMHLYLCIAQTILFFMVNNLVMGKTA